MTWRPYHRPAWAEKPAVIIASGPSLSDEQLGIVESSHLELRCHVITVNNTLERAPWADVAYFGDYSAIKHYRPKLAPLTMAEWVTQDRASAERWKITHLKPANRPGLSLNCVHLNGNSGAQAINVAACFGAKRILLLGFDMQDDPKTGKAHWFGQHPKPLVNVQLYAEWLHKLKALAVDARRYHIDIVNCTGGGVLEEFPHGNIRESIAW